MNGQNPAPLTALHATREVTTLSEKKNKEGPATSALTFTTFSYKHSLTLYERNQPRISAGIGRISGHLAESLYSGWGISLVRIASFVSRISRSAQVTAICHFPFKPLKHGTLRGLEPTARVCRCCLPDLWWNIAFLLTRMASGVQAQGVLAAAQSMSSVEVGC